MITSTQSIEHEAKYCLPPERGFTLAEVIMAATLSVLVLTAVLAASLFIGRMGYNMSGYSAAEAEVRRSLETFAADVRQASDIHWNSDQSITLTLPTATNATQLVTYSYDSDPSSGTYRCFCRQVGPADSLAPKQVLVHGVAADFAFRRYKLDQAGGGESPATNDLETKQIQVNLRAVRTGVTTVAATQTAISAKFILRNKRVSN